MIYYPDEIKKLSAGNLITSSPILKLNPQLDPSSGCLRVGGRLQHAQLPALQKHPLIIPEKSSLSILIIRHYHQKVLHGGAQLTIASLREKYWIINVRRLVNSVIHKCVTCIRHRANTGQQQMGHLPSPRVNPTDTFTHVGVDYAGPIKIRTTSGRGHKSYKGYICVFICFASKAVHLEAVTGLDTMHFMAAFTRFTSRRGLCRCIYSDCGTNFVGAAKELQQLFDPNGPHCQAVVSSLANQSVEWHFNPPAAPHHGGLWEAAVKSTKFHLRRVIGESTLTYEELATLLTSIEACLNSRPLAPHPDCPDDFIALTPAHLLIGRSLLQVPDNLDDKPVSPTKRWQFVTTLRNQFWQRWRDDYLLSLQHRTKWLKVQNNIAPGDLVIIKSELSSPARWPMGRIVKCYPGSDGLTRVVDVKTPTSTMKRPITKLVPLLAQD